jgi:predicted Zn-dependent peptidase
VLVQELRPETATLAALVPFVLRRGTRSCPDFAAMQARLDNLYGAAFRADVGKLGDKQLLSFHMEVPDGRFLPGRPDTLGEGLRFVHEVMHDPHRVDGLFDAGIVAQEREILSRQIAALINDKAQYASARLLEAMADGQRFGLRRYGRLEDVAGITPEALTEAWRRMLDTLPLWVFVVGAVDQGEAATAVRSLWGVRHPLPLAAVPPFAAHHGGRQVVEEQDVQQGKLNLGYGTGRRLADPDFPALMMYAGVLGGFPHSKLFLHVREEASLAYYAYARLDGMVGLMVVGSGIEFAHFEPALDIIRRQVDDMAAGRITDEEMAFTLEGFVNELRGEEDTPSALIGRQLERELAGGGLSGPELLDALPRVTRADVERVAADVALDTVYFLTRRQEAAVPTVPEHA